MIKFTEKSIFSLFLFLFTIAILISTSGMRSDVVLIPKMMAYILLVLSGIQVINDLFPTLSQKLLFLNKQSESKDEENSEDQNTDGTIGQRYLLIGWMALFVILIMVTNMIIACLLSFIIYLKLISKESWKLSILYSTIFTTVIYLGFVIGMGLYYFV
ncbi:tripartite tricarboxylate transporter TctB family protein [Bacillus sp. Marseille-P3661]|uniref:tripartite tricarboxylate transporter TctB family protein n=1 Tax=Bacillus sp. Marseille-P3661 TaxID=1936234 RepID=UPI000C85E054|nr:tripartite tricarboxylate transporter TctB family protein [Bacillus sp. Marseille-P3661]